MKSAGVAAALRSSRLGMVKPAIVMRAMLYDVNYPGGVDFVYPADFGNETAWPYSVQAEGWLNTNQTGSGPPGFGVFEILFTGGARWRGGPDYTSAVYSNIIGVTTEQWPQWPLGTPEAPTGTYGFIAKMKICGPTWGTVCVYAPAAAVIDCTNLLTSGPAGVTTYVDPSNHGIPWSGDQMVSALLITTPASYSVQVLGTGDSHEVFAPAPGAVLEWPFVEDSQAAFWPGMRPQDFVWGASLTMGSPSVDADGTRVDTDGRPIG